MLMNTRQQKTNKVSHGLEFSLSKVRYERFLRIYKIANKRRGFCFGGEDQGRGSGIKGHVALWQL